MKYKTLFRLLLKVVGVGLFGLSIPDIAWAIAEILNNLAELDSLYNDLPLLLQGPLQAALGLYFFFGGEWIVNKAIPSNRPYCPACGYDLSRSSGERCPECGTALPTALIRK